MLAWRRETLVKHQPCLQSCPRVVKSCVTPTQTPERETRLEVQQDGGVQGRDAELQAPVIQRDCQLHKAGRVTPDQLPRSLHLLEPGCVG